MNVLDLEADFFWKVATELQAMHRSIAVGDRSADLPTAMQFNDLIDELDTIAAMTNSAVLRSRCRDLIEWFTLDAAKAV